jgi:hypothetical protein
MQIKDTQSSTKVNIRQNTKDDTLLNDPVSHKYFFKLLLRNKYGHRNSFDDASENYEESQRFRLFNIRLFDGF